MIVMKIFDYRDVEAKDAGEGASKLSVRWLITKDVGAENFAMRLFEMKPGGHSPLHSHSWEHEIFILEGEGIVACEGEELRFRADTVIFIPSNEKHQLKNDGETAVKFLCLIPYTRK